MHTFGLTPEKGGVRVDVRMHVHVKSDQALITNKLWKVEVLPTKAEHQVNLLLTPAKAGVPANVSRLKVLDIEPTDRTIKLELCSIEKAAKKGNGPVFSRRQVRAEIEAGMRRAS